MRGLYAIIDTSSLATQGLDPIRFAEAVLRARPAALQLRDKNGRRADTLALLTELVPMCRERDVALFCNDRPDLALLAGCDGVHLGQRDLPPQRARQLARQRGGALQIGMSAHNAEELAVAMSQPIDYVAIGPVFGTRHKLDADPALGLAGLDALLTRLRQQSSLPVVAIGGINADSASQLATRCDAVAFIGALLPPEGDPRPYETAAARAAQLERELRAA
jgi:thiamine-phosphate pyrophosphorylase